MLCVVGYLVFVVLFGCFTIVAVDLCVLLFILCCFARDCDCVCLICGCGLGFLFWCLELVCLILGLCDCMVLDFRWLGFAGTADYFFVVCLDC